MTGFDDDNDTTGIAKLRKQFKNLGEENNLLKQQVALLMAEKNAASVSDVLASRGLDPRVAKFYPKDAATDETSVVQWAEENKDLFPARQVYNANGQVDETTLTDAEQRGYQALADISAFEQAQQMDFKSKIDAIPFDPQDPMGSQTKLLAAIEEAAKNLH